MQPKELADYCRELVSRIERGIEARSTSAVVAAQQLVRDQFGEASPFFKNITAVTRLGSGMAHHAAKDVLLAIIDFVERGILGGVTLKRQAQADVLADIFDQAAVLLDDVDYHPACGVMLVGAALEQFLRSWVEEQKAPLGPGKDGIDKFAKALRAAELIDKNDKKDIDSWAGTRNDAAHGLWDKITRERAGLMLAGVSLFIRQRGAELRNARPPNRAAE